MRSAAKKRKAAPASGRTKERVLSGNLSNGPSSEAATPSAEKGFAGSVSQMPPPGAAEVEVRDGAGSGPRGRGEEKGPVEGAVRAQSGIALADAVPHVADEGQGQGRRRPDGRGCRGRRPVGKGGGEGEDRAGDEEVDEISDEGDEEVDEISDEEEGAAPLGQGARRPRRRRY